MTCLFLIQICLFTRPVHWGRGLKNGASCLEESSRVAMTMCTEVCPCKLQSCRPKTLQGTGSFTLIPLQPKVAQSSHGMCGRALRSKLPGPNHLHAGQWQPRGESLLFNVANTCRATRDVSRRSSAEKERG